MLSPVQNTLSRKQQTNFSIDSLSMPWTHTVRDPDRFPFALAKKY